MLNGVQRKALRILEEILENWGKRDIYSATKKEIELFLEAGAKIIFLNYDNKDGTFKHEIKFRGKHFLSSTKKKIK